MNSRRGPEADDNVAYTEVADLNEERRIEEMRRPPLGVAILTLLLTALVLGILLVRIVSESELLHG